MLGSIYVSPKCSKKRAKNVQKTCEICAAMFHFDATHRLLSELKRKNKATIVLIYEIFIL